MEETEKVDYSFVLKEDNFVAGDIVLWDGEKKIVADPNGFSLPASGYTPIGVIVIPASHTDDGRARMMSTRWMSCDDPENGSITAQEMVWGTATDISGLTNYTEFPIIARYDDEEFGGTVPLTEPQKIYTTFRYCYLPSDYPSYTGETNPEDEGTKWFQTGTYTTLNESGETVANGFNMIPKKSPSFREGMNLEDIFLYSFAYSIFISYLCNGTSFISFTEYEK